MEVDSNKRDCRYLLVTGASGFLGSGLVSNLYSSGGYAVRGAVRQCDLGVLLSSVGDINASTDWRKALEGRDVVIHTAARVHVMDEKTQDPLAEFRKVNVDGTLNLARQAVEAGVKRFIFISSIKVSGESTVDSPFYADDTPNPQDPYAISKYEAEQGLLELAKNSAMEVVIIRPPLIYGANVKANFRSLINLVKKSLPLPLKSINNKRSIVGLDNLVDFIEVCIHHSKAANQIFLISDGKDVSTQELVSGIASAYGVTSKLFSFPVWLLQYLASFVGKKSAFERLSGSLQVDISKNYEMLSWSPKYSMSEQLFKMFKEEAKKG